MEDSALAFILGGVKPGDYVPPQCWETVAKILAFIFKKESEA
jgi:type III secretion system FlhB-like substrate exporter